LSIFQFSLTNFSESFQSNNSNSINNEENTIPAFEKHEFEKIAIIPLNSCEPMEVDGPNENHSNTEKTAENENSLQEKSLNSSKNVCSCAANGCIKKYCECYKFGKLCNENCRCKFCQNRGKTMFKAPKISEKVKDHPKELKKYIFPGHCNCKGLKCTKKLCECYLNGKFCSQECSCLECKNPIIDLQCYEKLDFSKMNKTLKENIGLPTKKCLPMDSEVKLLKPYNSFV